MFALPGFFILAFPCIWLHGVQQRTFIQEKHYSTWDIRELTARDFAGLSMPSPSHFVIILHNHHVFLVHLLISASQHPG